VVSNMSLEVNAALAEGAKQAKFEKEAQTRAGPAHRPLRRDRLGSPQKHRRNKTVAVRRRSVLRRRASAQPNGNQLDLEGQNACQQSHVGGATRRRDAEVRHTKVGQIVANFSLGTRSRTKTVWASGKRLRGTPGSGGETAEKRKRKPTASARVYVEGKLIIRNWIGQPNQKHCPQKWWQAMYVFTRAPSNGAQSGERARRRAYRRLAMTENFGAIAGLQSD
jgi:hypothetical protein